MTGRLFGHGFGPLLLVFTNVAGTLPKRDCRALQELLKRKPDITRYTPVRFALDSI